MDFRQINFDMDGTFVDFYGVENWLQDLENENTRPYEIARPLINLSAFARQIHRLQAIGYRVNIISWTSRNGSQNFNERIAQVKREWLASHLPSVHFDSIQIIAYGTPKSHFGEGILFDDEQPNRREWDGIAYNEHEIINRLRELFQGSLF